MAKVSVAPPRPRARLWPRAAFFAYLSLGTAFGFVLVKAEAVSWYRMQEMFRFQSFHMYGIFVTAIATSMLSVALIKRFQPRSLSGEAITFAPKEAGPHRYLYGGLLFGVGWGLSGICPGPIAALIGAGYGGAVAVLTSALLGTWAYARLRRHLPH